MAPETKGSPYKRLLISLCVTLVFLAVGLAWAADVRLAQLWSRLLWPLTRLMVFIVLGLAIGQIIEAAGWTRRVAAVAGPIFRFGRLGDACAAAFVTAFFSGAAANAMLYEFYQEKRICKSQLFLANLINHLPAYFLHLPTTMFIVLPLTGWAGGLYFLLTFTAVLLRTVLLLFYSRWRSARNTCVLDAALVASAQKHSSSSQIGAWQMLRRKLPERAIGVGTYVVPIYTLVYVMNAAGFFTWARDTLAHFITTTFIPVEALSLVVVSFTAEFTSGFAAAGALMQNGVLSVKQTVAALIIGNVVAFPVRALRHQLPRYAGIFTPKMGTQILLLGQVLRVMSLLIVLVVFYMLA
jgi:hypothetical protein